MSRVWRPTRAAASPAERAASPAERAASAALPDGLFDLVVPEPAGAAVFPVSPEAAGFDFCVPFSSAIVFLARDSSMLPLGGWCTCTDALHRCHR